MLLIGAVCGFIGGILVGRRNTKKVELALSKAKASTGQK